MELYRRRWRVPRVLWEREDHEGEGSITYSVSFENKYKARVKERGGKGEERRDDSREAFCPNLVLFWSYFISGISPILHYFVGYKNYGGHKYSIISCFGIGK
eukprot:Phypoly_transcript_19283.p1 GENE.Phypoly_transcript_19283~~Phypoly_transcript_19283.p1  ORF type:complete len:102 (+),score=12.68 Phypoly_transcript_19283:31-336(+)